MKHTTALAVFGAAVILTAGCGGSGGPKAATTTCVFRHNTGRPSMAARWGRL